MTIQMKKPKPKKVSITESLEDVINRGAKTKEDNKIQGDVRFTIRIPPEMIEEIDQKRKTKFGRVSRNQWILSAISEMLEQ